MPYFAIPLVFSVIVSFAYFAASHGGVAGAISMAVVIAWLAWNNAQLRNDLRSADAYINHLEDRT